MHSLLLRHQWTRLCFHISDDLLSASQAFLSQMHGDTAIASSSHILTQSSHAWNTDDEGMPNDSREALRAPRYKRFFNRNSPIAAYDSLSEIASLHHIFSAVLIVFMIGILLEEALEKGTKTIDHTGDTVHCNRL